VIGRIVPTPPAPASHADPAHDPVEGAPARQPVQPDQSMFGLPPLIRHAVPDALPGFGVFSEQPRRSQTNNTRSHLH
jgi:hypothetical protein